MTTKEAALGYLTEHKFSLFPADKERKPHLKWILYQTRLPEPSEVSSWWERWPEANIALVTGRISGITVLDLDTEAAYKKIKGYIPEGLAVPVVRSPHGWHMYFAYTPSIQNAEIIPGVEGKNDRSNITVPPSVGKDGGKYEWEVPLYKDLPPMPVELEELLRPGPSFPTIDSRPTKKTLQFQEGARDNTLFTIAMNLARSGMPVADIEEVMKRLAATCDPPWPEEQAVIKARSAVATVARRERNLTGLVKDWVSLTEGWFRVGDMMRSIGFLTEKEKANIHTILHRLVADKIVEKHPSQFGTYRRPQTDLVPIEWGKAEADPLNITWPLELEQLGIKIFPKNIVMLAGDNNAGKTSYLINFAKMNQDKYEMHYFSNDMVAAEFKRRLESFPEMKHEDWKFSAWERSDGFADVIKPNAINIIDYLQVHDNFWEVGKSIADIWERLDQGIAVIALQKDFDREIGIGKTFSMHKARLYMSMRRGRLKILKAKLWDGSVDPNNMARKCIIHAGGPIEAVGPWFFDVAKHEEKKQWKR